MTFTQFRTSILQALSENPEGFTWKELRESLSLPYSRPCPEWVSRMERESGLLREKGKDRAYIWRIAGTGGGI